MNTSINLSPDLVVEHIQPSTWGKANKLHIKKIISEFAHERLIHPSLYHHDGVWGFYNLQSNIPEIKYRFKAKIKALYHWAIDENSIEKTNNNVDEKLDSLAFISEFKNTLGITSSILPVYMEEITATICARSYTLSKNNLNSEELIRASYQEVEHSMTEGHPCFVANNGRIGYDSIDYLKYTPEANKEIQLIWLAGHKSRAVFSSIEEVSYQSLLNQELDKATQTKFNSVLIEKGINPEEYFFIPVHPWQWFNKLTSIFAPDIASQKLVCLGYSSDSYFAQQAIRTFFNKSHPTKFYVKTALSILNMGFMRGLSPYYMESTPHITEWVEKTLGSDQFLKEKGFSMLSEVATIGYRNSHYEELGRTVAHNKMLAALWRDTPISKIKDDERLLTMAALLHIDNQEKAFLPELIKKSGLNVSEWMKRYLDVYFSPLLHCFYYYDIAFMPHGENIILVLDNNNIPVHAFIKDITEEVMLYNQEIELPEKVKRIQIIDEPDDIKMQSFFSDIFDCFFRFLSSLLDEHTEFSENQFWKLVTDCILEYQSCFPELNEKFKKYDLFISSFDCCCLNRLQLKNNQQMIDLSNPSINLQFAGKLDNPIAIFKKEQKEMNQFMKHEKL